MKQAIVFTLFLVLVAGAVANTNLQLCLTACETVNEQCAAKNILQQLACVNKFKTCNENCYTAHGNCDLQKLQECLAGWRALEDAVSALNLSGQILTMIKINIVFEDGKQSCRKAHCE